MKSSASLISIGVIVVCMGMYFLYISPAISEVKALSMQKSQYNSVLDKAKDLAGKRDEILSEYNNIPQEDLNKLSKIVPAQFNSVTFANDVNNIAGKYGLTIKSLKGVENANLSGQVELVEENPLPYKTNIVSMTIKGPYVQFIKFLGNLETNLRLVDVKSLSVKYIKDEKNPANDATEFTLEVNVYSLR